MKSVLYTISGLAAGLLVFLWLPIRSHANPLIDWGNVKSFKQFMWSIQRKAWGRRALGSAPPDFAIEWIRTYAFTTQTGILALFSAFIGLLFTLKKRATLTIGLAAIAVPYAAGMIYGHLVQQYIDLSYLTSYGVDDWHLPIYMMLAGFAGFGVAAIADLFVKNDLRRASVVIPVFITI